METSVYMPSTNPGSVLPMPPRLHWGWVLLLSALTRSFFGDIWLLVQAIWIRKVTGRTDVQTWAIVNVCKLPAGLLVGLVAGAGLAYAKSTAEQTKLGLAAVTLIYCVAILVVHLNTVFKMRAVLEDEPIAIPLGGVMTFFFGPLYFQYFLREWVPMDYTMARPYPQYPYPTAPPQA